MKAAQPKAEFTDAEREKAYAYCAITINVWSSGEIGFEQGLVSIDTLKMVNEYIKGKKNPRTRRGFRQK